MALKDQPLKLQPYLFHGVELQWGESEDNEAEGVCPFCTKERHLHVNMKTGMYHCKSTYCGKSGNIYTFLGDYWAFCNEVNTRDEDLRVLADQRGLLHTGTLKRWRFAKSTLTDEWITPGYSLAGKVVNLYRWASIEGKHRLLSTPNCSNVLFGVHLWSKNKPEVHILEGAWDAMAYWERIGMIRKDGGRIIRTTDVVSSIRSGINIVGVAGYRSFNEQWAPVFEGLDVALLFHSDYPKTNPQTGVVADPAGYIGMENTYKLLNGVKSTKIIDWGPKGYKEDAKDGYDIRDICQEVQPAQLYEKIKFVSVPESWNERRDEHLYDKHLRAKLCTSYRDLHNAWRKALRWTDELNTALAMVLSVVVSTQQRGDQLWLRLIGPPGIAKTRLCEALLVNTKYCYPVGVQKGFHSGWKGEDPEEDYSLLAKANGMTMVTKEGDTLLSSPMLGEILSQGRDVYDGSSSSDWRNRKEKKVYSGLRMTWVIAGTKSLRKLNRSNLGDRFIDCVMSKPSSDEEDDILNRAASMAVRSVKASSEGTAETQLDARLVEAYRLTGGYVNWLRETGSKLFESLECPSRVEHQCKRLGQFVAQMRARPDKEDDATDHESELPTRLTSQFIRLSFCLAVVLNKATIDEEVMQLVLRSAISTSHGINLRVVEFLYENESGFDANTIGLSLKVDPSLVRKMCHFLHTLNVVRPYRKLNSKGKGVYKGMWELSLPMRRLYKEVTEFRG